MKKHTILIVDDDPENIDILYGLLGDEYVVKAATDGAQALAKMKEGDLPDVILLDVVLPGMNGYAVCSALKARRRTRGIPVIFITAMGEMNSIVKGFEVGGVDYIIKPFNPLELRTRLRTHIDLQEALGVLKNRNDILAHLVEKRTETLRKKNEQLRAALREKEALLREVQAMEKKLHGSIDMLNRLFVKIEGLQEEERRHIASEIHDRMGQVLTAIKMSLFQLGKSEVRDDGRFSRRIEATIALADEAIGTAQNITKRLRPDILENLGFTEAVRSYCRTMSESSGVDFLPDLEDPGDRLDKKTGLELYRLIQEAFTNVVRHARAGECRIVLRMDAGELRITISDNGIGIPGDKITNVNSLGIHGMKKRTNDIGGTFLIEGRRGGGTTVSIKVPVGSQSD